MHAGRALGIEITEAAYQLHAEKREAVRGHLDGLIREERALQIDARCITLALDMARRRAAELDAIFSRTPAASERDRLAKQEIARRYGEASHDRDTPAT